MEIAQVTRATIVIFMATGAVITFAGVWLMWRLRTHTSSSKIDILGVKVESPSAGLLVFLVGAAFLSVPLFVDATPEQAPISSAGQEPTTSEETTPGGEPPDNEQQPTSVPTSAGADLAVTQAGKEVEPNDSVVSPNIIPLGAHIEAAAGQSPDWFRIDTPSNATEDISVVVYGHVHASFRNQYGDVLSEKSSGSTSETFRAPLTEGPYYVRISRSDGRGYSITTAMREPEQSQAAQ